jgi:hypothetical protein
MKFRHAAVLAAFLASAPSAVSACAVCFGGADSNLANGFFWGVLLLLILPFALTAGFVTMVLRAGRRRKAS